MNKCIHDNSDDAHHRATTKDKCIVCLRWESDAIIATLEAKVQKLQAIIVAAAKIIQRAEDAAHPSPGDGMTQVTLTPKQGPSGECDHCFQFNHEADRVKCTHCGAFP